MKPLRWGTACRRSGSRRGGLILAVVLMVVGLLALVMAGFIFFVRAEISGLRASAGQQQLRLAAESGLEEVVSILRLGRDDASAWFDNPERFRHGLVWSAAFDRQSDPMRERGSRLEYLSRAGGLIPETYRFSVVARQFDAPQPEFMRFGITPESSRLNLNTASEDQITRLLTPLLLDMGITSPQPYIDALLDWRDADDVPRESGAENDYYNNLRPGPPYNCKNGPFDTIEELLLVRGFTAAILYGEDVNRNGILDANENDGDESFPRYDNADGALNVGIAPYLTVFSREPDTASDNRPRINLNASAGQVTLQLSEYFAEAEEPPLSPATIAFITQLKQNNFDFTRLGSAAELYAPTEVPPAPESEGDPNAPPGEGPQPIQGFIPVLHEELLASPATLDELPGLIDYLSVRAPQQAQQPIFGRINVNTAPLRVLELVPGMTTEMAAAIVSSRSQRTPEELATPAWLVTAEVIPVRDFKMIAPFVTTRAYQQHVEILGYADHMKQFVRYEWVIEMVGPLPQVKYHRDLTRLGMAWPIDDDSRRIVE